MKLLLFFIYISFYIINLWLVYSCLAIKIIRNLDEDNIEKDKKTLNELTNFIFIFLIIHFYFFKWFTLPFIICLILITILISKLKEKNIIKLSNYSIIFLKKISIFYYYTSIPVFIIYLLKF